MGNVFKEKQVCSNVVFNLCFNSYAVAISKLGALRDHWLSVTILDQRLLGFLESYNLLFHFYGPQKDMEYKGDSFRMLRVFLCQGFEGREQRKERGNINVGISTSQISTLASGT